MLQRIESNEKHVMTCVRKESPLRIQIKSKNPMYTYVNLRIIM